MQVETPFHGPDGILMIYLNLTRLNLKDGNVQSCKHFIFPIVDNTI